MTRFGDFLASKFTRRPAYVVASFVFVALAVFVIAIPLLLLNGDDDAGPPPASPPPTLPPASPPADAAPLPTTPPPVPPPPTATSDCTTDTSKPLTKSSADAVQPTVTMKGVVRVGSVAPVSIVLSHAPIGLSGFLMEFGVTDTDIAQIESVEFPEFGIARELESNEKLMRIAAVDLLKLVQPDADNVRLATLNIRGVMQGDTEVGLRIIRMDDDRGDPFVPRVIPGTITVC